MRLRLVQGLYGIRGPICLRDVGERRNSKALTTLVNDALHTNGGIVKVFNLNVIVDIYRIFSAVLARWKTNIPWCDWRLCCSREHKESIIAFPCGRFYAFIAG